MRIETSNVAMSSTTSNLKKSVKDDSFKNWMNKHNSDAKAQSVHDSQVHFEHQASHRPLYMFETANVREHVQDIKKEGKTQTVEVDVSNLDKRKMQAIQQLIESLTGKKVKFYNKNAANDTGGVDLTLVDTQGNNALHPNNFRHVGNISEITNIEQEKVSFTSKGTIKAEDGREINFSVQMYMARKTVSSNDAGNGGRAIDPLMINLDNQTAELTNVKFSFDINSDKKLEQISFAAPGGGFLSLDLNNDGKINNGGELFGPESGNGFMELAAYDKDGNNWIDENDSVFDKLRIWTKDSDGGDNLMTLGETGIGAIYLGNVDTPFGVQNDLNEVQGQIMKTGVYIRENGTAGTIQHVDLVTA